MKYKKTTNEFMEMFDNAKKALETSQNDISDISKKINKQLEIIHTTFTYISKKLFNMQESSFANENKIILAESDMVGGLYSMYGNNITPHLLRTPINLTNYYNSDYYMYKKNAKVLVNGEEDSDAENIVMHDSIDGKEMFFKSYGTSDACIDIKLNNGNMLSSIRMNTIEICPILEGSFNITKIEVFSPADSDNPEHVIKDISNVGNTRYILDSKTKISSIRIYFDLKYKDESTNKYILGLKHIYLLDADYSDGSYAVVKIHKKEPIKYIYNTIELTSQNSEYNDSTLEVSPLGIKYYMDYDNGSLGREITLSTRINKSYISGNTNTVYMYLPIYTSYTSITPSIECQTNE